MKLFQLFSRRKLSRTSRGYIRVGNRHRASGQLAMAEESYRRAIRSGDDHPFPHLCLGDLYADVGRHDQAIEALSKGLLLKQQSIQRWAETETLASELPAAEGNVRADCPKCTLSVRVRCRLGHLCWGRGRLRAAAEHLTIAAKENGNCIAALLGLSAILLERQQADRALLLLARAAQLAPDCDQVFYLQGMASRMSGRLDEASQAFDRVLHMNPDHLGALYQMASCHQSAGHPLQALSILDHAIGKAPGSADLLALKAQCLESMAHRSAVAEEREFFSRASAECLHRVRELRQSGAPLHAPKQE